MHERHIIDVKDLSGLSVRYTLTSSSGLTRKTLEIVTTVFAYGDPWSRYVVTDARGKQRRFKILANAVKAYNKLS